MNEKKHEPKEKSFLAVVQTVSAENPSLIECCLSRTMASTVHFKLLVKTDAPWAESPDDTSPLLTLPR